MIHGALFSLPTISAHYDYKIPILKRIIPSIFTLSFLLVLSYTSLFTLITVTV
jgi:hypothetical protein